MMGEKIKKQYVYDRLNTFTFFQLLEKSLLLVLNPPPTNILRF